MRLHMPGGHLNTVAIAKPAEPRIYELTVTSRCSLGRFMFKPLTRVQRLQHTPAHRDTQTLVLPHLLLSRR